MTHRHIVSASLAAAALLALSAPGAEAQQGLTLGIRAGASVASADVELDQTFDTSNRTGFVGGVFLDWSGALLGFQVGAQYTQKGVDLDLGAAAEELSLDYLEIPAVVKLGLPLGLIRPGVFAGAGLSFNTSCESDGVACDDDVSGTDVSGIIGADLSIHLGGISLWADGRYHVGLSDITEGDPTSEAVTDLKNRAWIFQAGLGFPLR